MVRGQALPPGYQIGQHGNRLFVDALLGREARFLRRAGPDRSHIVGSDLVFSQRIDRWRAARDPVPGGIAAQVAVKARVVVHHHLLIGADQNIKFKSMDADRTGAGESCEGIFRREPTGSTMTMYHTGRHVCIR